eukprot:CAMPEP_0175121926 /NCGR_PEP_ID=MMETSP0087-20121206/1437_1 /TAXON_ID=136419 /ORGANISM="Unknown Unknown, Strain D1" /LENGTH=247 /DNA_ID=CAMNT_0016403517 /DNA_START=39 /DNA_END=783 /DNA_ORIENTATION=-
MPDLPAKDEEGHQFTFFPKNLHEARLLYNAVAHYKEGHLHWLVAFFSSVYLFKQTFCIPGSAVLNALAGAFFGLYWGFLLVCACTAVGASLCYILSWHFGRRLGGYYFRERLAQMQAKLKAHQADIFSFLLFMRIFPFSPNFLINLAAPMVGVKFSVFFFSVLFGLMPYNFVCVQAGLTLHSLDSMSDLMSGWTVLRLLLLAVLAASPKFFKGRFKAYFSEESADTAEPGKQSFDIHSYGMGSPGML